MNVLAEKPTHGSVVLSALRRAGITRFYMHVSGSGDSGDINVCDAFINDTEIDIQSLTELVSYTYAYFDYEKVGNKYERVRTTREKTDVPLHEALVQLAEDAIEATDIDWYNNEGGAGEYTLNVLTGVQNITMSVNTLKEVHWSSETYE